MACIRVVRSGLPAAANFLVIALQEMREESEAEINPRDAWRGRPRERQFPLTIFAAVELPHFPGPEIARLGTDHREFPV